MKLYALIHLLTEILTWNAIGRMKCCIVTIRTPTTTDRTITVGTCKTGIYDYFLQAFSISALEIADKRVISLAVRESVFFESVIHRGAKVAIIFITFAPVITKPLNTYLL